MSQGLETEHGDDRGFRGVDEGRGAVRLRYRIRGRPSSTISCWGGALANRSLTTWSSPAPMERRSTTLRLPLTTSMARSRTSSAKRSPDNTASSC